jgi:uncharacterized protein
VITLDTSGFLAVVNQDDANHAACLAIYVQDPGPFIVPAGILAEIDWALHTRIGDATSARRVRDAFLEALQSGGLLLDCGEHDYRRIQQLTTRYDDLRLGIADSAVVACAERRGGRILTTDLRHFAVIARGEKTIRVLPE